MVKGKSSGEANKPKKRRNYKKISWHQCQCSGSSQIPSQDDPNYHQFLSLYKLKQKDGKTKLIIYDTENKQKETRIFYTDIILDYYTSITQLPNGELFCYGSYDTGITVIIDRNYGVRTLPSGTPCGSSPALYFENNIYCFGGLYNGEYLALSRKFDLETNRWSNLASFPETDYLCHSVVFNGNILVSGYKWNNLWLYSIEIDSFSIIPYTFSYMAKKLLINVEKLYLIECNGNELIYESEDEYNWKRISISGKLYYPRQMYCLYNKEKVYISADPYYYQFDLKKKVIREIKKLKV